VAAREADRELPDERSTRLEERCGTVALERELERESDRDAESTRLVDRCGMALDRDEPERCVEEFERTDGERLTREDGVVTVERLDRWVVRERSPSDRQPPERVVAVDPLRTEEAPTFSDRLTEVVPAAPPRTVVRERVSAPLMAPRAAPELVERTEPVADEPPLRERFSWKLRTELTTCCRCWSNEVRSRRAERVLAVAPPRE